MLTLPDDVEDSLGSSLSVLDICCRMNGLVDLFHGLVKVVVEKFNCLYFSLIKRLK
jgi:hypothetical protein